MEESRFNTVAWARNSNIYEVNLRQYKNAGTFNAFAEELPRLSDMGVAILWFMPITPISHEKRLGELGSYYACSDYIATNPEYGSIDDFKNLVSKAHELGMKVIIDWVANHTGWDHVWTRTHPEFYRKNQDGQFFDSNGWSDVIDLNYDNEQLRLNMCSKMEFWIDNCNIDGFRCDMAMLVPLSFWKQARSYLDTKKELFWLAECEEIDYHQVFDATYCWKFLHRIEAYYRNETGIEGLIEVLDFYTTMFPKTAMRSYFTTNHDENSHSGSEYERLGDAALVFSVFCCTWNSIPLVYSGQELPNKKRLRFFEKDTIDWTGSCSLHNFFKQLFALRSRNSAMCTGDPLCFPVRIAVPEGQKVLAFERTKGSDQVIVLLNLSASPERVDIKSSVTNATYRNLFSGATATLQENPKIDLEPWGYAVLEKLP